MAAGFREGEYEARSPIAAVLSPSEERGIRASAGAPADLAPSTNQHQFRLLTLSAEILSALATAEALAPACQAICHRLRSFFSADHVAMALVNLERRSIEILGFTSSVVNVSDVPLTLTESDIEAYREALEGRAQAYADLGDRVLNPGTELVRRAGIRSLMRAPFRLSGGLMGLVSVSSATRGHFGTNEAADLQELCTPIGLAVDRVRLLAAANERQASATALATMLSTLNAGAGPEEAARRFAEELRLTVGADLVTIHSFDIEAGMRTRVALVGDYETSLAARGPLRDSAGFQEVLDSPTESFDASDPGDTQRVNWLSNAAQRLRLHSAHSVRLDGSSGPVGVLVVGCGTERRFQRDVTQLLDAVAPMLALVIDRALMMSSLHEQTERTQAGLREADLRAARLEAINRVLTRLGAGGNPDHLATGFLAECRVLFESDMALVAAFDQETGLARRLALDSSLFGPDDLPNSLLMGSDPAVAALSGAELIEDLEGVADPGPVRGRMLAAGLRSGIRVPLVVRDHVIGAVVLWSTTPRRYTAEDVAMLGTLTRPLAIALERASALDSLAESELKFRSLIAQAEEMILLFDSTTLRIVDANAYTERALGYSRAELLALDVDHLVDADREDVMQNVQRTVQQGELHLAERAYRRKDGSLMQVDVVASTVTYGGRDAVLALVRDVSERRSIQAQLVQSQKMESLGLMAGNLAHDFNNLLTTILGFAGLLKRSSNLDVDERENLGLIEDAARSAADLTGRLLSFSRGGLVKFGPVELRTVIDDTLRLAGPSLHSSLTVTTTFAPNAASIEGDAGQVQQALLNIVLNAKDAMPEGGHIAISLTADDATATLTVCDDGPGMSEETQRRIFEPFYTTKPLGSGTGLGMAITYGIVQGHHGDITVESKPGKGTTFKITLPLLDPGFDRPGANYSPGEGNLILVVDDDEMVRRTTSATLAELGYNVVEAPGGATAVQVVKARPDRIAAVLLDLVMPGMTGSETFRALTELRPDLPVIVCTGYAADAHIDRDVKRRIAGLVQKPFTAERLDRALREAGVLPTRTPRI